MTGESWEGQEQRSPRERIAVLESHMERIIDPENGTLVTIEKKLDEILKERVKLGGMVGGASLVVSGIVMVLSLAKDWALAHLGLK
jgi:hypothetical protein